MQQPLLGGGPLQVERKGTGEHLGDLAQEGVAAETHRAEEQQRAEHVAVFVEDGRDQRCLGSERSHLVAFGKAALR